MARIRTIKPEFWTSEQVMECSANARLLFIGLWNFCDDVGRMAMSPKRIKAQILPSDDVTSSDVLGMLQELSANGLIRFYTVDGKDYLAVTGWQHQRIDKPQKPLTPDPPDPHSPNDPGRFSAGREKEKDRKGDKTGGGGSPPREPLREAPTRHQSAAAPAEAGAAAAPPTDRETYDRIERRCRALLPTDWVNDAYAGPMVKLVADGADLEREVAPAVLDIVVGRRSPIRTWALLANAVAERIAAQRKVRVADGLSAIPAAPVAEEDKIDLGSPFGRWPETALRAAVAKHREMGGWVDHVFGPPPGQPGCRIPPRLLLEAA